MNQAFVSPFLTSFVSRSPNSVSPVTRRPKFRVMPTCVDSPTRPSHSTPSSSPSQFPAIDSDNSALREGILMIAIGKHGSKSLTEQIIPKISHELLQIASTSTIPTTLLWQRASFLGALYMKSNRTAAENNLLSVTCEKTDGQQVTPKDILQVIQEDPSTELYSFAVRLLNGETLDMNESEKLGNLLYSQTNTPPPAIKALIAHVMRVRHETGVELAGMARAVAGLAKQFWKPSDQIQFEKDDKMRVHIAEPFDGTITWDLLTPLICRHLNIKYGLRTIMGVGRSSGPKLGPNLLGVIRALGLRPSKSIEEIYQAWQHVDKFGAVVNQVDSNPGLDEWVSMRRTIAKRPGIATIEKYADVMYPRCELFISSAFHDAYLEKMAEAAEGVGYEAYVIIGRGMEGSTGLGIRSKRNGKLLVGWKQDGRYEREEIEFDVIKAAGLKSGDEVEQPEKGKLESSTSAMKIEKYMKSGNSGDEMFDRRVQSTITGIDKALNILVRKGKIEK